MPDQLRGPQGRRLCLVHLTTVDMSLALLLGTELAVDVAAGLDVVGMSAPGPYVDRVEALGVRHEPVPFTRSWDVGADVRAARAVARSLRRLRPDVVHTHTPKAGVVGRLAARAVGVPVVVDTCHGLWLRPGDSTVRRAAVLGAESLAARAAHAQLFQNAEDLQALRHVTSARRSSVVGNGIDLERFVPDDAARHRVRAELGVAEDELLVGGVGRVVAEKGVAELARTAELLEGRARFVWVGPSDGDGPRLDPGPALRLVGEVEDMPALYSALDVFVLPSHREGFSRSAMEAAACGLPMVLSDIRGCREVGEHDRHLLLVPRGDQGALTAAVERLLADPALRGRLGTAARERAVALFDQREVAAESLRTYARVAAARGLGWSWTAAA